MGGVGENGIIVYVDHIFDCSDPIIRIDKPILHLDAYGRRLLTLPDPFAICWLALTVPGAETDRKMDAQTHGRTDGQRATGREELVHLVHRIISVHR